MQATGARDLCAGFGSLSTSYASQHVSRRTCVACTCHGSCLPVPTLSMHMTCMGPHACLGLAAFPVCLECHSVSWPARPQRCNSLLCTCYGVFCARPLPADGRAFQGRVLAVISCISAHNACMRQVAHLACMVITNGASVKVRSSGSGTCQSGIPRKTLCTFAHFVQQHASQAISWITIATHACSKHGNVCGVLFLPKKNTADVTRNTHKALAHVQGSSDTLCCEQVLLLCDLAAATFTTRLPMRHSGHLA